MPEQTRPAALEAEASPALAAPILRAAGVQRTFIDGQRRLPILQGVSLEIQAGEVVALVGRSGSGKSSLLHLLGLLDRPDAGEIHIAGQATSRLGEFSRAELRARRIGFIFQHYFLLPEFTVLENLLLAAKVAHTPWAWLGGERRRARERALALLAAVELEGQRNQRPQTLSGGERQRAALARGMLLRPEILLCDEPTGNLDPQTGSKVMRLILELSRENRTAVLIVTHDPKLAELTSRTLTLEQGVLR